MRCGRARFRQPIGPGGYPEHSFNWDVVLRIREELTQLGVRTAMSRGDDNTLGPCVDQADLAGLNLVQYPAILIELGNMKNGQEAAAMVTAEGRAKYAAGCRASPHS